jgi:DNA repair protein RadC
MQLELITDDPSPPVHSAPIARRALRDGVEALGDAELLTLLLGGSGSTAPSTRAQMLLDRAGNLTGLHKLGAHGILSQTRIGTLGAARVAAALELGRRVVERQLDQERVLIGSVDEVVSWARPKLALLEHEEVWLLSLDGRNGLKSTQRIAQGGLHGCALTTRDVLRPALRDAASAIVLVHNHPSGDPGPSPEDVEMTRALGAACEVVGVPLLDHVVVARGGASSLLELGILGTLGA